MSNNQASAAQRRVLRFNSVDDLIADVERIVAADRLGIVRTSGTWSVGQIFNHLACWIGYGYEGFPPGAHAPWFVRAILRFMKKRLLRDGMKPGVRIPGAPDGTFGTEPMTLDEGAEKLRAALQRLKNREPARHHSPALGHMSDDERIQLQLRHAELHLSFVHY
jgi:hypothetical protein